MKSTLRIGLPLFAFAFAAAAVPAPSQAQTPTEPADTPASAMPPAPSTTPASGAPSGSLEPATDSPLQSQLADVQDKLATALKSYSMILDENAQLKAEAARSTNTVASLTQDLEASKATIASLQGRANEASQIDPLRTALRQAQDEAGALAAENAQLRTQLALAGPSPGGGLPPTRPGSLPPSSASYTSSASPAQTTPALTTGSGMAPAPAVAAAASAPPNPAAAPTPTAPRTYKVAEGDTLSKIALKFYGSAGAWKKILDANRDVVKDERSLYVGVTLKIP